MSITLPMERERVFMDIQQERINQDLQWGGPSHDDTHSALDWGTYICYQEAKLFNDLDPRRRFIKIAALAVAAVESIDRSKP